MPPPVQVEASAGGVIPLLVQLAMTFVSSPWLPYSYFVTSFVAVSLSDSERTRRSLVVASYQDRVTRVVRGVPSTRSWVSDREHSRSRRTGRSSSRSSSS